MTTSDINTQNIQVTILYFASLADKANTDKETISIDKIIDLPSLYQKLATQYDFDKTQQQVRVAINHNFANWSDPINDGDSIAFIPPVAGG